MRILTELSEDIIKKAAVVSSNYDDRTISSVIEECFYYGLRSLYADTQKPNKPKKLVTEAYSNNPSPNKDEVEEIQSIAEASTKQAIQDLDSIIYESDWSDSYSEPVLSSDGLYEL